MEVKCKIISCLSKSISTMLLSPGGGVRGGEKKRGKPFRNIIIKQFLKKAFKRSWEQLPHYEDTFTEMQSPSKTYLLLFAATIRLCPPGF